MQSRRVSKILFWVILVLSIILLSIATVYAQVNDLTVRFLKVQQEKVHLQMMAGVAGNPWQYRILADRMLSFLIAWVTRLGIDRPEIVSFIVFRFLQCLLIFFSAGIYYRKLGLSLAANLFGLSVLAWGMSYSLYNSDLSFNVFFDVAFYLIAAILIISKKFLWTLPLMILAAFNRETSVLIPLMLVAYAYFNTDKDGTIKPALFHALGGLIIFGMIFVGLRFHYGPQPFLTADGYYPGFGLLLLNLTRIVTWEQLLITFGIVPILSLFAYRFWPQPLKVFFWTVVPIWILVHFFAALIAETRLLLVPFALVFIPGVFFGLADNTTLLEQPSA